MAELCDISTPEDVRTLVDSFYDKVGRDQLLAPIFNDFAQVDWTTHLPTMYRFWESMLFGAGTYQGAPFRKHAVLPVRKEHFARWLALFVETVNFHFAGPKAEEAKGRAASIADTFAQRMGLLKDPYGIGPDIRCASAAAEPPSD
jgi:hemoglobin